MKAREGFILLILGLTYLGIFRVVRLDSVGLTAVAIVVAAIAIGLVVSGSFLILRDILRFVRSRRKQ